MDRIGKSAVVIAFVLLGFSNIIFVTLIVDLHERLLRVEQWMKLDGRP